MAGFNERQYELNEVGWWSGWAQVHWIGKDAYVMFSDDFREYFFNRAGFSKIPPSVEKTLAVIEGEFERRGRAPHIFVQSNSNHPTFLRALEKGNYRISDQMSVMEVENPSFKVNAELVLEMGLDGKLEEWAGVYLSAFYGEMTQLEVIVKILEKVLKVKEVSLVLARLKGKAVGCLALYRSERMCGAYCVGTEPSARGIGVASAMLDFSRKVAAAEGRRLILQTILSDGVEPFYLKAGFRRVYAKDLFVKGFRRAPG